MCGHVFGWIGMPHPIAKMAVLDYGCAGDQGDVQAFGQANHLGMIRANPSAAIVNLKPRIAPRAGMGAAPKARTRLDNGGSMTKVGQPQSCSRARQSAAKDKGVDHGLTVLRRVSFVHGLAKFATQPGDERG